MDHSKRVRDYITAETLSGLRRKQRALNARHGAFFRFENEQWFPQPNGKTRWVAFYYMDLNTSIEVLSGKALDDSGDEE